MSGQKLAQLLEKHVIPGDVNLDQKTIDVPLICHKCTFDGSVSAVGATFKRTVDLSGSTFERDVDMSQATFLAPALFGPAGPTHRPKDVNPLGKHCRGQGAWFLGKTNFQFTTFDGPVIFEAAAFRGQQQFDFAGFNGEALFTQGCSVGPASFKSAVFGDLAEFGGFSFQGSSNFASAAFRGQTDFSQATYAKGATYTSARFSQGASFEAAKFEPTSRDSNDPEDTHFDYAVAGGPLDFSAATFRGGFASYLFPGLQVSGDLSFAGATITPECPLNRGSPPSTQCLFFGYADDPSNPFSATTLELSVDNALHAVDPSERAAILQRIESSAKNAGDLGLANDAHYQLQVISSQSDSPPLHFLDFVFYRTLAGYLVRPLQPLVALLVLAALITLVRQRSPVESEKNPPRTGIGRHVHEAAIRLGTGYAKSLSLIGRGKSITEERPLRSVEAFLYRLLLACVLIGLANSNPTLRQMVDALH